MSGEFLLGGAALGEVSLGEITSGAPPPAPTVTLLQMLNHLRYSGSSFALLLAIFIL